MNPVIDSIASEYRRYQALAEGAVDQLTGAELVEPDPGGNSVATIAWHVGGNLASRFTDFLTTDGEKPWRDRESEFADRRTSREEILDHWHAGWSRLFDTLSGLTDADLERNVSIRGVPLTVIEALHRSLAHTAYHVGQIVHIARVRRGAGWRYLSIPPGGTTAYNADPSREKGPGG